ncbi:hypothetical protein P153DRAFT_116554 [Dothidotthia symphoricarpi CBS 119687]|uniref:SAC3/GANP/THP3 conserved domain-containing protein n=1 Tax=Dothidotthia symphoricarpi CBS 119687 TaxID=1392245 RepID=A0A6A6A2W2_9PLEO|nr:uncharacterized protein P153DRAFT_116554 [Dothidotthia symphoricarpi CBS 119687]KAF2124921.1 hypothetical protein P153DRAFT_116554 [Dothidotthia symphoricarpi CBS 119687]
MSLPSATVAWSRPMQSPAYNTVQPRTTLHAAPSDVGTATSKADKAKKVEWPPAVRDYVRRAFDPANAIPNISSSEMQTKLKETISFYAERNQQDAIDWPTYPLPQELLQEERRKAALASGFSDAPTNASSPSQLKKRKSQDPDDAPVDDAQATVPPWRRTNLASRMTFVQGHNEKRHKKNVPSEDALSKFDQLELEKRRQRFQLGKPDKKSSPPWKDEDDTLAGPVVGLNQSLEKSYFRLTAPPKAETVRPLHILHKTLAMLTQKWKTEKNYNYICNQFKSLRQDLTVQHIKNAFTVKVYEIHARISLEKGDLDKTQEWIKHALDVRSALALGNYHKFFRLYLVAQNMGGYLMDMFIERERLNALANMSRAYVFSLCLPRNMSLTSNSYTSISLRFLTDELGFDNDEACCEFLALHNARHIVEQKMDGNKDAQFRVKIRDAASLFENLRAAAFSKIDIKGQI